MKIRLATFHIGYAVCFFLLVSQFSFAQPLKPGFDKEEYRQLMLISARTGALDAKYLSNIPEPAGFKLTYRSAVVGLDNRWDLWTDDRNSAVISIRGTTAKTESWINNFYASMVSAKGALKLSETNIFRYELATNPNAAVHVGWLLSLAHLSPDILAKIDSCYQSGTRNILLMGHSQGGVINFLLTSYLYSLQKQGKLPADLRFKTYCSAAPKPGNLYYAYDYEAMTQGGWAYNVVNSADWVPETPMSVQTLNDFNQTNPFVNAGQMISKQGLIRRLALKHAFNRLDKPTKRAQQNFEKYLGKTTSKIVRKSLPDFIPPEYYKSNNYVRTGSTIVLLADDEYYKLYPDGSATLFVHHLHKPYLYLLDRLPDLKQ